MKIRDIPLHDVHVHIQKEQFLTNYLETSKSLGTEILGITEHLWDITNIPTSNPYYQNKTLERVLNFLKNSPQPLTPKLLWGCETEYAAPLSQVGICPPQSDILDYIIVPHSHFFLPDFTFPASLSQPEEIADYMKKTFLEVASLPVTTVIAHPFDPTAPHFQQQDFLESVFHFLPESVLEKCFSFAAKNRKIIEINLGSFVHGLRNSLYQKTYLSMFAIAKQVGCRFCLASDAQKPEDLSRLNPESAQFIIDSLDLHRENIAIPGIDTPL